MQLNVVTTPMTLRLVGGDQQRIILRSAPGRLTVVDRGHVGPQGPGATVAVGTVTTGAPGTDAAVTNSGTASAAVLNFVIPRGNTGAGGASALSWARHDFSGSIGAGPYTLPVTLGYDLVEGSLFVTLDGRTLEPGDDFTLAGLVVTPVYAWIGQTLVMRWQEVPA